jgi:hypothetical protein
LSETIVHLSTTLSNLFWKLKKHSELVVLRDANKHHRTLVAAASAYSEIQQRDQYQEAIDWRKKDAEKLKRAIEYHQKELFDITYGMLNRENSAIANLNPLNENVEHVEEIYMTRGQLGNE